MTDDLMPLLEVMGATADEVRELGRSYDIPECCIAEFVADLEADRFPAKLRGSLPNATGVYVPCSRCLEGR